MKIKSFATYGVGMDIIYEDILSTGAIADLRIKSEDEKSPELYDAWKRMEARVLEYLGKLCQLDTKCMLNVSKMDTKDIGILRELEARIRGYIRGERAQAKFDFSLKDNVEDNCEE